VTSGFNDTIVVIIKELHIVGEKYE